MISKCRWMCNINKYCEMHLSPSKSPSEVEISGGGTAFCHGPRGIMDSLEFIKKIIYTNVMILSWDGLKGKESRHAEYFALFSNTGWQRTTIAMESLSGSLWSYPVWDTPKIGALRTYLEEKNPGGCWESRIDDFFISSSWFKKGGGQVRMITSKTVSYLCQRHRFELFCF